MNLIIKILAGFGLYFVVQTIRASRRLYKRDAAMTDILNSLPEGFTEDDVKRLSMEIVEEALDADLDPTTLDPHKYFHAKFKDKLTPYQNI